MTNATARVLELFLQTKRGVTGVTHVTDSWVTPERRAVTPVTPVTYQKRAPENAATGKGLGGAHSLGRQATIDEYDRGTPRAWAEAVSLLDPKKPLADVPQMRWQCFIEDCGHFLAGGWASRAAELGWEALDLFGCNRERPFARIDRLGLLWLLNGRKIVALTAGTAIMETPTDGRQTCARSAVKAGHLVLAWELSK